MARRMMMVPVISGRSAMAPAPAAPMRDCAHPVARAGMPMARAAAKAVNAVSSMSGSFRIWGPPGSDDLVPAEGLVRASPRLVELAEELDIVETKRVDGGGEDPQGEVEGVEEEGDRQAQEDVAGLPPHEVCHLGEDDRGGADRHQAGVGEDVP